MGDAPWVTLGRRPSAAAPMGAGAIPAVKPAANPALRRGPKNAKNINRLEPCPFTMYRRAISWGERTVSTPNISAMARSEETFAIVSSDRTRTLDNRA